VSGPADPGIPERDPFADLVSRGIGRRVPSVAVEELPAVEGGQRKRLRFVTDAGAASAIFERAPRGATLEAQLLPFLARKTDRVAVVHARGIPPPHASLGPWVLMEDVLAGPPACDGDPVDVLRAKLAIAVAADRPALRALGLRESDVQAGPLAAAPLGLVHGGLDCASAHRVERGVVIVGWSRAFLGPTVLDAANLAADLEKRGDVDGAARVREVYERDSGDPNPEKHWQAAHLKFQ
jgi:hypothetical protein